MVGIGKGKIKEGEPKCPMGNPQQKSGDIKAGGECDTEGQMVTFPAAGENIVAR